MRLICFSVLQIYNVSIHASVKDATYLFFCIANIQCFNPRICKRCDCIEQAIIKFQLCFNPRICKRCDEELYRFSFFKPVSIHASVKDATFMGHGNPNFILFQSTHL